MNVGFFALQNEIVADRLQPRDEAFVLLLPLCLLRQVVAVVVIQFLGG